jgi:glycosyltransferase involved in cell wall biosynthesis
MATLKMWQVVRRYRVDLIHAHWVIPNGFTAAVVSKLTGRPLFISLHGSDIFFARRNRVFGTLATWAFAQATGVTACSPELYEGARQLGASPQKLHMVPWGADPEVFAAGSPQLDSLRQKFGLKPNSRLLLTVGRLVGKKGFINFIEAFGRLSADFPDVSIMLVGDGPERSELQAAAQRLGIADRVHFAGQVEWPDIPDYLTMADIFVAPSIHDHGNVDGLPTVILEAMAAGKPIIASRVGGIPLVVRDGVNGFLVDESDIAALAGALHKLLCQPQLVGQYGEMSRKLVETQFNWRRVALSFVDMYCQREMTLKVPYEGDLIARSREQL